MKKHGFTLVELLIGLAMSALLLAMSLPALQQHLDLMALSKALDASLSQFRRAQALSLYSGGDVLVVLATGENWCIVTAFDECDCEKTGDCVSPADLPMLSHLSHPQISFNHSSFSPATYTRFAGGFGTSHGYAGTLTFNGQQVSGKVVLSNLGRVRACIEDFQYGAYDKC
ncbi:prepilin-type N-terminal cleavage/methylation domain-containing protein [Alteromonas sp. C1M14]|uniref:prepilin-type N-terminal cleavage/methylation domain-containing protein n=1 Tax=Alteromonas sp. C1M14 TaxID=2841567 RepID=UPI001C08CC25|nr:prepilin-type N-terminal cleavage/methylation domain-containing protein [Alteromonas sp. C1M14]MBU2979096.1 prepilin-type N-terminal cleavage/methylation domain-containing protein [Alteromonas sp. C1M14]